MYIGCVHQYLVVEVQDGILIQGCSSYQKLVTFLFLFILGFGQYGPGFGATLSCPGLLLSNMQLLDAGLCL